MSCITATTSHQALVHAFQNFEAAALWARPQNTTSKPPPRKQISANVYPFSILACFSLACLFIYLFSLQLINFHCIALSILFHPFTGMTLGLDVIRGIVVQSKSN